MLFKKQGGVVQETGWCCSRNRMVLFKNKSIYVVLKLKYKVYTKYYVVLRLKYKVYTKYYVVLRLKYKVYTKYYVVLRLKYKVYIQNIMWF